MLFWIIAVIGLLLVFALNIFGTNTVLSSHVTTVSTQRKLIMLIWLFPYLGTIIAMIFINKTLKQNSNQSKQNIESSLISLADKFDAMEKKVRRNQTKSSQ